MRLKFSKYVVFFMLFGWVLVGCIPLPGGQGDNKQQYSASSATVTSSVIARENDLQGTASWKISAGKGAITQIQAYASATSVQPGQPLTFYISTQVEGTLYSIGIYRL